VPEGKQPGVSPRERAELVERGVAVSELFHDVGDAFHRRGQEGRLSGPDSGPAA
jgi:hypothetical protein